MAIPHLISGMINPEKLRTAGGRIET